MKRIKDKELVVVKTDKTGMLAAVGRDEYIQQGEEHTEGDTMTTREECNRVHSTLNGHVAAMIKIFEI